MSPKVDSAKEQSLDSNQNESKIDSEPKIKKESEKPHVQIPRVRSSRQSDSVAETSHVESTKEAIKVQKEPSNSDSAGAPKQAPKEQPKVNPLLWQLHKKKMDGGTIQLGHLLDQHRYLMMENSTDPIPKVCIYGDRQKSG